MKEHISLNALTVLNYFELQFNSFKFQINFLWGVANSNSHTWIEREAILHAEFLRHVPVWRTLHIRFQENAKHPPKMTNLKYSGYTYCLHLSENRTDCYIIWMVYETEPSQQTHIVSDAVSLPAYNPRHWQ